MKRGGSLSFLVGTISNVLVMEIGWTDVGRGGYFLVSCAHSNTSLILLCMPFKFFLHTVNLKYHDIAELLLMLALNNQSIM